MWYEDSPDQANAEEKLSVLDSDIIILVQPGTLIRLSRVLALVRSMGNGGGSVTTAAAAAAYVACAAVVARPPTATATTLRGRRGCSQ